MAVEHDIDDLYERVGKLEGDVSDLKSAAAVTNNRLGAIETVQEKMDGNVDQILAILNKGKGVMAAVFGLGGALGLFADKILGWLLKGH